MLTIIFVVEVASEVAEMVSVSEPNSLRVVFEAFRMMFCGGMELPEPLPEPELPPDPELPPEPELPPDPELPPEPELPPDPELPPSQVPVDSHESARGKSTS